MATETETTEAREPGQGRPPVLVTRFGGEQRIFPVGAQVRVGRDPTLELVSVNPLVSRQCHGVIASDQGGATYTDQSRRGTFLDGKQLNGPLRITESVVLRRPLHFIILADCSGGMKGEKIQALNFAIADMLPHLAAWERDQEQAQVFVRAIAFATEPWWHIAEPQPVARLGWKPLQPVPKGLTNMGPAFALATQALAPGRIERRALRPALLLITDGLATDPPGGFETGLSALMAQPAGKAALRLAIAIGRDAQSAALDRFIGDPGVPVLVADSTEDIADRLVAVSLAVSRMSEAGVDRGAVARRLFGVPGDVPSKIFDQDTIVWPP